MVDQWQGPGGPAPPLYLDQTEDQRVEKSFLSPPPPAYLRVWMTVPPPSPYLNVRAPVVQKVDNAIHRINLYSVDSAIGFPNTYPLIYPVDSTIQRLNNPGLDPPLLTIGYTRAHACF